MNAAPVRAPTTRALMGRARPYVSSHWGTALAMLAVLTAYTFFTSKGTMEFRRIPWDQSYYASLTESMRYGHVSLMQSPDPRLAQMKNPYDYNARGAESIDFLWDLSYFRGKYYLYFTVLPVFLVYLPFRWIGGGYPSDQLVTLLFSAWSFLLLVAFAKRALRGRKLHLPFALWVLLIGFGNTVCFNATEVRMYEVAIACGMAMSATWAYALLRFSEEPTIRRAAWMALWLALAIASRPNFGVLLLVAGLALWKTADRWRIIRAALVPLAVVAIALMAYNVARFRKPLEFGVTYQMTFPDMRQHKVCSLCKPNEFLRLVNNLVHYEFWAPSVGGKFPFVDLQRNRLDPDVSYGGGAEQTVGVGALVPITILGSLFALLFVLRRDAGSDPPLRGALRVMAGAWLILLGLSTCWWVTARYTLDFMMLMTASSAVIVEYGLDWLGDLGIRLRPLRVLLVALACYTIAIGFEAGFMGVNGAFARVAPDLFQKLAKYGSQTQ
ncbi:MAG: hypothetical protein JO197_13445 [Acidobacteria bacterium]|nr:hypothetical protein [Acidobacteriota bacterium]MBV9477699.1 hypothetical protein [Acidobacteriota bacterium]